MNSDVTGPNERLLSAYRGAGFSDAAARMTARERSDLRGRTGASAGMGFSAIESGGLAIAISIPQVGADFHYSGRLGADLDAESGAKGAYLAALSTVSELQSAIHDLRRVQQVVFLQVFLATTADFTEHERVADGASRAMADIFGSERAAAARTTLGVVGFAAGQSVELVAFFRLTDEGASSPRPGPLA